MARYRSKVVQALFALLLLVASTMLWPSLGTTAIYAMPAACPTPGTNSICIASSPSVSTTLNGTDQTVPYNFLFTLNNNVNRNWHVTFALTRFTTASTPHRTLPTSSTVTGVTVLSSCSGSSCPGNVIAYPVNVTADGSAVTIYDNTSGGSHGVGSFTLQASTNLSVPANAYVGTYSSTLTIAFITGSP